MIIVLLGLREGLNLNLITYLIKFDGLTMDKKRFKTELFGQAVRKLEVQIQYIVKKSLFLEI